MPGPQEGSIDGALLWHWDGVQWSSFAAPAATWLYDLAQGEGGTLWAAGIAQAQSPAGATVARGAVLLFDGLQWTPLSLPPNSGGLYALALLEPGVLVTGGDNTLLRASRTLVLHRHRDHRLRLDHRPGDRSRWGSLCPDE